MPAQNRNVNRNSPNLNFLQNNTGVGSGVDGGDYAVLENHNLERPSQEPEASTSLEAEIELNADGTIKNRRFRPRLGGKPSYPAAVHQVKGGSGLGSKPEKPRRCDRCTSSHRRCARPLKNQGDDNGKRKGMVLYGNGDEGVSQVDALGSCKRCVQERKECLTSPPGPRKPRKRKPRAGETYDPAIHLRSSDPSRSQFPSQPQFQSQPQSQSGTTSIFSSTSILAPATTNTTTKRAEDSEELEEELEVVYSDGRGASSGPFASATASNLYPTSPENNIRRTQQAGNLRMELISQCRDYIRYLRVSADIGFIFDMFDDFVDAFERCGRDPRGGLGAGGGMGLKMGRWGELKCALYCAAGAHVSKHSSILGCDPSQLHLEALKDSAFSTMSPSSRSRSRPLSSYPYAPARLNPPHTPIDDDLTDLRSFGKARDSTVKKLWMICARVFEQSGIWDVGDNSEIESTEEMVLILDTFARLVPFDMHELKIATHKKAVEHWRRCKVPGGFPNMEAKADFFESLLQDDLVRVMIYQQLPIITDSDILTTMASPNIDPKVFITFEGQEYLPEPKNLYDQHQLIWATGIAIQRLICNLGPSLPFIPPPRGELIIQRMHTILSSRETWRSTTYTTITQPDGTQIRMQRYGKEIPSSTSNDETMVERSWFCFLRIVEERFGAWDGRKVMSGKTVEEKREWDEILKEVWKVTVGVVDQYIGTIQDAFPEPEEFNEKSFSRMRIHNFSALPQSYKYFGRYLQHSKDGDDLERRKKRVNKTHSILKRLSFNGAHFLRWLTELEEGLKNHPIPVFNDSSGRSFSLSEEASRGLGRIRSVKAVDAQDPSYRFFSPVRVPPVVQTSPMSNSSHRNRNSSLSSLSPLRNNNHNGNKNKNNNENDEEEEEEEEEEDLSVPHSMAQGMVHSILYDISTANNNNNHHRRASTTITTTTTPAMALALGGRQNDFKVDILDRSGCSGEEEVVEKMVWEMIPENQQQQQNTDGDKNNDENEEGEREGEGEGEEEKKRIQKVLAKEIVDNVLMEISYGNY